MADSVSTKSDGGAGERERNTSTSEQDGAAPPATPAAGGAASTGAPAPGSATAGTNKNAKTRPVKDKRCLFCGQEFTASSLGRHYDTFITRDRVDGVHDLEEIRRIRSSVTRRTVKPNVVSGTSTKDEVRDSTEPPGTAEQKAAGASAQAYPKVVPPTKLNPTSGKQGYRVILNQPSWEATGVINDIPKPVQSQRKSSVSGYELGKLKSNADQETVRALELALREVLDSVKAAS